MSALTEQEWAHACKWKSPGLVRLKTRYQKARKWLRGVQEDEWSSDNKISDAIRERDRAAELIRRAMPGDVAP